MAQSLTYNFRLTTRVVGRVSCVRRISRTAPSTENVWSHDLEVESFTLAFPPPFFLASVNECLCSKSCRIFGTLTPPTIQTNSPLLRRIYCIGSALCDLHHKRITSASQRQLCRFFYESVAATGPTWLLCAPCPAFLKAATARDTLMVVFHPSIDADVLVTAVVVLDTTSNILASKLTAPCAL